MDGKSYLRDNRSHLLEQSGFIKRKHIRILSTIVLFYAAAFIATSFIAYFYAHNPYADIASFLCFFGIAAFANTIYLKRANDRINEAEFNTIIFSSALKSDCDYCIIFDYNGNIIHCSSNYRKDFSELFNTNQTVNFKNVINSLSLTSSQITKISEIIESETNNLDFKEVNQSANKNIIFRKFNTKSNDYTIDVIKYLKPLGFSCLKINVVKKDQIISRILDEYNIGLYELNPSGFLLECNQFICRILGINEKELTNSYLSFPSFIHEENSNSSIFSGARIKENWQGFIKLKNSFGEYIDAFIIQIPTYSAKGTVEKIIGYLFKIDDDTLILKSKGLEKQWLDYTWKCFFQESPYPVATLDKNCTIQKVNETFDNLFTKHTIGKKFHDLFSVESKNKILTEMEGVANKNIKVHFLKSIKSKKEDKNYEIYIGKILDLEGDHYGFLVRIEDTTQHTQLKESFSHAQRIQTMGQLVGSVAHDFNNILTAISGFCDLLLLRHSATDPSYSDIMQIKQSSDRATNLVKRLLAFSRKQTLKPDVINLAHLFNDFNILIRRLIGSEIAYNIKVDNKLWKVLIDPVQIEQVILNLVVNAKQAIESNGKLSVGVTNVQITNEEIEGLRKLFNPSVTETPKLGEYVKISIKDNGKGIDKKTLPHIFEPFFTTKAEKSGTGLGLSTVYGIIKQSEGHIYVNTAPGKGTEFIILLKKLDDNNLPERLVNSGKNNNIKKVELKDTTGKETIVLVEDEDSVRTLARNIFESKGYNVIDYPSAKVAFEKKDEFINVADIIVSDVIMTEMTGPAFIKEIHKIRPNLPTLFMSGYAEDAFNEEYGSSRNFNFIAKPFNLRDLLTKVREVICSEKS